MTASLESLMRAVAYGKEHGKTSVIARLDDLQEAANEISRLRQWVADCQAGMYVNCVYCGHRYGPDHSTPVAMADVLKRHIEQCPEHPLSHAKAEIARLRKALEKFAEPKWHMLHVTVYKSHQWVWMNEVNERDPAAFARKILDEQ